MRLVCLCNIRNLPSGWRNSHFGISESKNVERWTMDLTWRLDNGSTVPSKSLDHPNSSKSSWHPSDTRTGWRLRKSRSLPHRYLRKNSTHTLSGDSVTKVVLYKLHPTSAEELGSLCIVLPWQTWTTMAQMGIQWVYRTKNHGKSSQLWGGWLRLLFKHLLGEQPVTLWQSWCLKFRISTWV